MTFHYKNLFSFDALKLKYNKSLRLSLLILGLLFFLPFLITLRLEPQLAFQIEDITACLITLFSICSVKQILVNNKVFLLCTIFGFYLLFDILLNSPIYYQISLLYVVSLFLLGLLSIGIQNIVLKIGFISCFTFICQALTTGALLQCLVNILSYMDLSFANSLLLNSGNDIDFTGNIGQRNLYAHYQYIGLIACCYLILKNRVNLPIGLLLLAIIIISLGMINSRSIFMFILLSFIVLTIISIKQKTITRLEINFLVIGLLALTLAQLVILPLYTEFFSTTNHVDSTITRIENSQDLSVRFLYWENAWQLFLAKPLFGHGWSSFGYENFILDSHSHFIEVYRDYSLPLASHCHNIILNLLAEVGLVGTSIVIIGIICIISSLFKLKWSLETLCLVLMLIAPISHSLVEFPLWYLNFAAIFIVLLTLLPLSLTQSNSKILIQIYNDKISLISRLLLNMLLMVVFITTLMVFYGYERLNNYSYTIESSLQDKINTSINMLKIGDDYPLLRPYSELLAVNYIVGISSNNLPTEFNQPLYNYAHYLPQRLPSLYYLTQQCNTNGNWEINEWNYFNKLEQLHKNSTLPASRLLSQPKNCSKVFKQIYPKCVNYYRAIKEPPKCSDEEVRKYYGINVSN